MAEEGVRKTFKPSCMSEGVLHVWVERELAGVGKLLLLLVSLEEVCLYGSGVGLGLASCLGQVRATGTTGASRVCGGPRYKPRDAWFFGPMVLSDPVVQPLYSYNTAFSPLWSLAGPVHAMVYELPVLRGVGAGEVCSD